MKKILFLLNICLALPAISLAATINSYSGNSYHSGQPSLSSEISHNIQQMQLNTDINRAANRRYYSTNTSFGSTLDASQAYNKQVGTLNNLRLQQISNQMSYDLDTTLNQPLVHIPATNSNTSNVIVDTPAIQTSSDSPVNTSESNKKEEDLYRPLVVIP